MTVPMIVGVNEGDDVSDGAKSQYAQTQRSCSGSGRNGTARAQLVCFERTPSDPVAVEQAAPRVGNPDASLSLGLRSNGAVAGHGRGAHDEWFDSVAQPLARNACALGRRSQCSSGCHDRSSCTEALGCANGRTCNGAVEAPSTK
jgi:hypothetical protein